MSMSTGSSLPNVCPQVLSAYTPYLDQLMASNHFACCQILDQLLEKDVPLIDIYRGLFERSLVHIGRLWENNEISVATEHMVTALTESLMAHLYPVLFKVDRVGRKAIVSCTVNEYHQVGGKMVADLFEAHGWDSFFLGANTPVNDLLDMVGEKAPDVVCFSLALYANLPVLNKTLQQLTERFPDQAILVGGQAFSWGGADLLATYPQAAFLGSLPQLEQWIDKRSVQ